MLYIILENKALIKTRINSEEYNLPNMYYNNTVNKWMDGIYQKQYLFNECQNLKQELHILYQNLNKNNESNSLPMPLKLWDAITSIKV